MKLYFFDFNSLITKNPKNDCIIISDRRGGAYCLRDDALSVSLYDDKAYYATKSLRSKPVDIYLDSEARYSDPNLAEDEKIIIQENGVKLTNIGDIDKYALLHASVEKVDGIVCFGYYQYVNKIENLVSVFYNFDRGEYKIGEYVKCKPTEYGNEFYHLSGVSPVIKKVNDDFLVEWEVDSRKNDEEATYPREAGNSFNRKIVLYKDTVIANLSARGTHRTSKTNVAFERDDGTKIMATEAFFVDGKLHCFFKKDGSVKWVQTFPLQIDDCTSLNEEQVILASDRFLYVVDCENGNIVNSIDTKVRDTEECASITLLVHGDYVFSFFKKECCIQIRNRVTLDLLRSIDSSNERWAYCQRRPTVIDNYIFVPVFLERDELSGGAILTINTDNIHAELTIEETPDFEVGLPSKNNPGGITIKVDHPDWGTVLRLAERGALNAVVMSSSIPFKKYFRPRKVHFEYSGYVEDKEIVEEKMAIFKKRFERYVLEPHVPGIGIGSVEFEYTLK